MHAHTFESLVGVVVTFFLVVIASTNVYAVDEVTNGDTTASHPVWLGENDRLGVIAIPKVRIESACWQVRI